MYDQRADRFQIMDGKFKGRSFKRVWRGYAFSDDECESLAAGQEIEVRSLRSKSGSTYSVKGRLEEQSFTNEEGKEISFLGFMSTGFIDDGMPHIPNMFCGHTFSKVEKDALIKGRTIHADGMVGKKGKPFSADISYGERDDGRKGLILTFDNQRSA